MLVGSPADPEAAHAQAPVAPDDVKMLNEAERVSRWCCRRRCVVVLLLAGLLSTLSFSVGAVVGARLASSGGSGEHGRAEGRGQVQVCGEGMEAVTRCAQIQPRCTRSSSPRQANGLVFIGLSLSRQSIPTAFSSNNGSVSRQTQFDFNLLQDRDYQHVCQTNDDGWLVGGGEADAANDEPAWKLANADSAHVEIAHVGNGNVEYGGLTEEDIISKMRDVRFKPIRVKPARVALNSNDPPEVELRFEANENPELAELQDKLRRVFTNPSVSWPPYFHMTMARKVRFYSEEDEHAYLQSGVAAVHEMRQQYPDGVVLQPDLHDVQQGHITQEEIEKPGGVYLFWGRNKVLRYFPPTSE